MKSPTGIANAELIRKPTKMRTTLSRVSVSSVPSFNPVCNDLSTAPGVGKTRSETRPPYVTAAQTPNNVAIATIAITKYERRAIGSNSRGVLTGSAVVPYGRNVRLTTFAKSCGAGMVPIDT